MCVWRGWGVGSYLLLLMLHFVHFLASLTSLSSVIICHGERATTLEKKRTGKGLQVCGQRIKKRDVMIPPGVRYVLRWPLLFIYESRPGEAWVNIDSSLGLRCSHWSTREGLITWSVRSGVGGGKARAGTRLSRWWSPLWCLFILTLVHLCNTGSRVTESSSTSRKWILGGYKL